MEVYGITLNLRNFFSIDDLILNNSENKTMLEESTNKKRR